LGEGSRQQAVGKGKRQRQKAKAKAKAAGSREYAVGKRQKAKKTEDRILSN
jgi:hypothetical protein